MDLIETMGKILIIIMCVGIIFNIIDIHKIKNNNNINHYVAESKALSTNAIKTIADSNSPPAVINFYKGKVLFFQIHADGVYINRNYPLKNVLTHVMNSIDEMSGKKNIISYNHNIYLKKEN